jgi:TPR repeat protein
MGIFAAGAGFVFFLLVWFPAMALCLIVLGLVAGAFIREQEARHGGSLVLVLLALPMPALTVYWLVPEVRSTVLQARIAMGEVDCYGELVNVYATGSRGLPWDAEKMRYWMERGARAGHAPLAGKWALYHDDIVDVHPQNIYRKQERDALGLHPDDAVAIEFYRIAASTRPEDAAALRQLADRRFFQGRKCNPTLPKRGSDASTPDARRAVQFYETALQANPDHREAREHLTALQRHLHASAPLPER